jgi:hypothetical protein
MPSPPPVRVTVDEDPDPRDASVVLDGYPPGYRQYFLLKLRPAS